MGKGLRSGSTLSEDGGLLQNAIYIYTRKTHFLGVGKINVFGLVVGEVLRKVWERFLERCFDVILIYIFLVILHIVLESIWEGIWK